jgi:predicted AlkP superfamily pyrophosphatase or phosphodiesterase
MMSDIGKRAAFAMAAVLAVAWTFISTPTAAAPAGPHPVLLISVDGMQPGDVLAAGPQAPKLPTLRAMMAKGAFARSVKNVNPTVTMPNHFSLITGFAPTQHGVYGNLVFDPLRPNTNRYFWYAKDFKVPNLWDVVKSQGGSVASLNWPGSVGADAIDHNIPAYWRDFDDQDLKLIAALSTPRLVKELETATDATLAQFIEQSPQADRVIGQFAAHIIRTRRPAFFTVHFTALDHARHVYGIDSAQARAALENTDTVIADLVAEGRKAMPDLVVAVVSDHGFAPVHHDVNVLKAFADAGLIEFNSAGQVTDWLAQPWGYASASVFIKRPDDLELRRRVSALLEWLSTDPSYHLRKVVEVTPKSSAQTEPTPIFYFDFEPGFQMGQSVSAPLLSASQYKATHGYMNDLPAMNSAFFMDGPSVPPARDLGQIDMLDIAPTLAQSLGVKLHGTPGKPLF